MTAQLRRCGPLVVRSDLSVAADKNSGNRVGSRLDRFGVRPHLPRMFAWSERVSQGRSVSAMSFMRQSPGGRRTVQPNGKLLQHQGVSLWPVRSPPDA